jgi:hypothetical protein
MIRRAYIIGTVALGLTVAAVHTSPAYYRLVSTAESFQRYFHDLKGAGSSLSPIERFMFSLVLANTKAPEPAKQGTAPERRS